MPIAASQVVEETTLGNVAEAVTLVACLCLGQLIWTFVMHRAERRKLCRKLSDIHVIHEDVIPGEHVIVQDDTSQHNEFLDVADNVTGVALLEHYGVFGVAPGAWRSEVVRDDVSECTDEFAWSEDESWEHENEHTVVQENYHDVCASSLLEHYNIFGALPGTWTENSAVACDAVDFSQDELVDGADDTMHVRTDVANTGAVSTAFSLLEQYDVFGVATGTWVTAK